MFTVLTEWIIPVTWGLESLSQVLDRIKMIPVDKAKRRSTPAVRIDSVTGIPRSFATGSARK